MSPAAPDGLGHGDIEAVLETRRELGARYDAELVDGFAERVQAEIERRVGAEVQARQQAQAAQSSAGPRQLTLGIVSLVAGIPITAITVAAGDDPSILSTIVAWGGIAAVNIAHAIQSRP